MFRMRPNPARWVACVAILMLANCFSAAADPLSGLYSAQGQFPNGTGYQGAVKIIDFGSAQAILWKLKNGQGYKGLAIHQDNVLGAAYTMDETPFGLVVYRINGGKLDGQWLNSGDTKAELGRETIEGSADLTGQYNITLGQNRDGTTNYTGRVLIKPDGKTFLLIWLTPNPSSIGRGVRIGNTLVVAFSPIRGSKSYQNHVGVVAYKANSPESLEGVWATGGASQIGTETLTRHAQ